MNSKVQLMIFGNPVASQGFGPILYLNSPAFNAPAHSGAPGVEENSFYFRLAVTTGYTYVTLEQNRVRSAGANRDGVLKFAMAVPKGMKLEGGATPYDVLMAVREVFLAEFMERNGDCYSYKASLPGPESVQKVLDRFSFRPAVMPHRVMTGSSSAYLALTPAGMKSFFTDVQYPQFQDFKEIIVCGHTSAAPLLELPSNPRVPEWKLVFNGKPSPWPDGDILSKPVSLAVPCDERYYEFNRINFTLNAARRGEVPNVTVDEANETVSVALVPRARRRDITISVSGDLKASELLPLLRFAVGGKPITPTGVTIRLEATDIDKPVTVEYPGGGLDVTFREEGNSLLVKAVRSAGKSSAADGLPCGLKIELDAGKHAGQFREVRVEVEMRPGADELLRQVWRRPCSEAGEVELTLPPYIQGEVTVTARGTGALGARAENVELLPGRSVPLRFSEQNIRRLRPRCHSTLLLCIASAASLLAGSLITLTILNLLNP